MSEKPVCRMVGHQQLVNHVLFSPDGKLIASTIFDKSDGQVYCETIGTCAECVSNAIECRLENDLYTIVYKIVTK